MGQENVLASNAAFRMSTENNQESGSPQLDNWELGTGNWELGNLPPTFGQLSCAQISSRPTPADIKVKFSYAKKKKKYREAH